MSPRAGSPASRRRCFAAARGLAAFLGGFALLNLAGELRSPGFDANIWWIDLRMLPAFAGRAILGLFGLAMLAFAARPDLSRWRRLATGALVAIVLIFAFHDTANYYGGLIDGKLAGGPLLSFSLLVSLAILFVGAQALALPRPESSGLGAGLIAAGVLLACLLVFPLAQIHCFGRTDYRRAADVIVVPGAKVYADGRPSDALADRLRTACELYRAGLAPRMIFSGGPGAGAIHETEGMRRFALEAGVPEEAILLDPGGLNTQATVENTRRIMFELRVRRALVVSHFYHLPRIKLCFARAGLEVYTVPAKESYTLSKLPWYVLREVAALWVYYSRPLAPQAFEFR